LAELATRASYACEWVGAPVVVRLSQHLS
jgi:hypothetical protein